MQTIKLSVITLHNVSAHVHTQCWMTMLTGGYSISIVQYEFVIYRRKSRFLDFVDHTRLSLYSISRGEIKLSR